MEKSTLLSLTIAIVGIVVLQASQGIKYTPVSIEHLNVNCKGEVEIKGEVANTFHSNKGNYIGIVSEKGFEVPVILNERKIIPGDQVKILGRASKYREDCFLFPDQVKIKKRR